MASRAFLLPGSVLLAFAIVTACATSEDPDLSGDPAAGDGGTTLPDQPVKDAGSTPPPPPKKDAGSPTPTDSGPPQDAAPVDPAACDTSNFFQALIYASEASDQAQPVPCPCDADAAPEQCCYMGQTCIER